jgi:hypothetical protein
MNEKPSKGEKTRWISEVLERMGPDCSVDEVKKVVDKAHPGQPVSTPLVYKVIRERKNPKPAPPEFRFTTDDLRMATTFVNSVGSLAKAKKLLDALEDVQVSPGVSS